MKKDIRKMTDERLDELWDTVKIVIGEVNADYGAAVTLGSVFGETRKSIERYRKALQFYANERTYDSYYDLEIFKDCGDKAREALKA